MSCLLDLVLQLVPVVRLLESGRHPQVQLGFQMMKIRLPTEEDAKAGVTVVTTDPAEPHTHTEECGPSGPSRGHGRRVGSWFSSDAGGSCSRGASEKRTKTHQDTFKAHLAARSPGPAHL